MEQSRIILVGEYNSPDYGKFWSFLALHELLKSSGNSVSVIESDITKQNEKVGASKSNMAAKEALSGAYAVRKCEFLEDLNANTDTFVLAGGVQWRVTKKEEAEYWTLGFAGDTVRKLALGTSFGVEYPLEINNMRYIFDRNIPRFAAVAVREESGARFVRDYLGTGAVALGDPVFWQDAAFYRAAAGSATLPEDLGEEPFVFGFFNAPNAVGYQLLDEVAAKQVLCFNGGASQDKFERECKRNALRMSGDYTQLVSYIVNANSVVTDDYYAICFALLFHKPFLCLKRQENTRELLDLFGLSKCFIDGSETTKIESLPDIDWHAVDTKLEDIRHRAVEWVRSALVIHPSPFVGVIEWTDPFFGDKTKQLEAYIERLERRIAELERAGPPPQSHLYLLLLVSLLTIACARRNACSIQLRCRPILRSALK